MHWLAYAAFFVIFVLIFLPGLFLAAVASGRRWAGLRSDTRRAFVNFAYALAPIGLCAWVAFSLSFVLTNLTYLGPAVSDPFGWGWDLFDLAAAAWTPLLSGITPTLQALVLLVGLAWSVHTALGIASEGTTRPAALRQAIPVSLFCLAVTAGMLVLLVA
jgi:hypothetical protein